MINFQSMAYFDLEKCETCTLIEKAIFHSFLCKADFPIPKNWDKITIWWSENMGQVCNGAFNYRFRESIFLTSHYRVKDSEEGLARLVATLGHELIHRNDYIKNPWTYHLKAVPAVRQLLLEPQAERWEKKINICLGIPESRWL